MDYNQIILILGAIAAIIRLMSTRNVFSILIVSIQITAIGLSFVDKTISYYIFGSTIILSLLYLFSGSKEKVQTDKNWIWLFLVPIFFAFIFGIFNFPFYNIIRLAMLIPLTFFVYALINHRKYKYEIGVMFIFAADSLNKLLEFLL